MIPGPLSYRHFRETGLRALVESLGHRIAEEVGTLYNTLGEVKAEVLVNKVVPRKALLRLRTLADKLTEMKAEGMVNTLAKKLAHLEIKTLELDNY